MAFLEDEEIEGLDTSEGTSGWGEYPLDAVFVRHESRSVVDALRRIDGKRYILDPEFQRDFVWHEDKQSKLIESCVMRIPLPVFYLAEARDGRIIVVDGLQRLTTFHRYVNNKFRIKGLLSSNQRNEKHPLEGKRFEDLPLSLQERILDTQLITYILDSKAPERARLDIFERVNSGVPLTRQQMRNALYSGEATAWLKEASESKEFKRVTGNSLDTKTMRDREAINRFCAFSLLKLDRYRGDMDGFLANSLVYMNSMKESDLKKLKSAFAQSMAVNDQMFKEHAFRKSLAISGTNNRRNILNIALWDVCSTLLADYAEIINTNKRIANKTQKAIMALMDDADFSVSITYSTNSTQAVNTRFEMLQETIEKAIA